MTAREQMVASCVSRRLRCDHRRGAKGARRARALRTSGPDAKAVRACCTCTPFTSPRCRVSRTTRVLAAHVPWHAAPRFVRHARHAAPKPLCCCSAVPGTHLPAAPARCVPRGARLPGRRVEAGSRWWSAPLSPAGRARGGLFGTCEAARKWLRPEKLLHQPFMGELFHELSRSCSVLAPLYTHAAQQQQQRAWPAAAPAARESAPLNAASLSNGGALQGRERRGCLAAPRRQGREGAEARCAPARWLLRGSCGALVPPKLETAAEQWRCASSCGGRRAGERDPQSAPAVVCLAPAGAHVPPRCIRAWSVCSRPCA